MNKKQEVSLIFKINDNHPSSFFFSFLSSFFEKFRPILLLLLCFLCFSNLNACSFSKKKFSSITDEEGGEVEDLGEEVDSEDLFEGLEEEVGEEISSDMEVVEDSDESGVLPEDEEAVNKLSGSTDENGIPEDESAENSMNSTSDEDQSSSLMENDPSEDVMADSLSDYDQDENMSPKKKVWISVKKIKEKPFSKAGFLINAVYIVRSGDTLESVSDKIFQANRVEDLLKINSHFRKKPIKVGEKIYYNSQTRPTDRSNLLVFYEDQGLSYQTYTSSKKENIRKVSERLLGHKDSWKEIWATNKEVKSKWMISAGTSFIYWNLNSMNQAPSMQTESHSPAAFESPESMKPINQQAATSDSYAGPDSMENPGNPSPPSNSFQPPQPLEMNPGVQEDPYMPSPPPPSKQNQATYRQEKSSLKPMGFDLQNLKNNQQLFIGAGIFLFLILLLLFLKKKKQKKIIDFTNTNQF